MKTLEALSKLAGDLNRVEEKLGVTNQKRIPPESPTGEAHRLFKRLLSAVATRLHHPTGDLVAKDIPAADTLAPEEEGLYAESDNYMKTILTTKRA